MTDQDNAGVVVPPPVVCLIAFLAGLGLERLWPLDLLPGELRYSLGPALIAVSLLIFALALRQFLRARTSVIPHRPASAIITDGLFRYSRNPIYVSMALLLAGLAVVLDNLWVLAMTPPALIVIHYFVVLKEEAYLERRFGEEYLRYKASVRRWI